MMMCRPIVQQAEQAADAADAHMSVGRMDMISRAAAKMTNSAAADELASAEIWTLAKTATELFGASVSKFANKFTRYSIDSSLIIDLTAKCDDGQFWDLGTREDLERFERMQQEHQTELLIKSAPCISFRALLRTAPSEKETKHQIKKVQDEERETIRSMTMTDNDTLRKVPHPSNEGLALQARVKGVMTPRKRICCTVDAYSFSKVCTDPLLRTVGNASCPEVNSENSKKHEMSHRLTLC